MLYMIQFDMINMRNWYVFVGSLPQVPGDLFFHGIKILIHLLFSLSSCVPSRVRITQLWNINWSCDGFHHRRPLPTPRNGPTVISPLQNQIQLWCWIDFFADDLTSRYQTTIRKRDSNLTILFPNLGQIFLWSRPS